MSTNSIKFFKKGSKVCVLERVQSSSYSGNNVQCPRYMSLCIYYNEKEVGGYIGVGSLGMDS